ncbi:MAG TPA: penicillin-binding transpeptidase domain-containing protein [Solirubrobacteraceae bacterium]|nr:penicillin-binding transpeptidase domain-containing protein [Solirubrobacteraceae bacterium]
MPEPIDERRSPMTPQLALRVAIVGSVVLALFAILFFRLWFLQVLTGNQYVAQAQVNKTRSVVIPAERGEILDRTGKSVLVSSTKALTVQIVPTELPVKMSLVNIRHPPARDAAVFDRLAHVLNMKTKAKRCTIYAPDHRHPRLSPIGCDVAKELSLQPYGNVTIKQKTSKYIQYYVAEHQNQYRGVQVQETSIPGYPHGTLAAQVLGTVGQISREELKSGNYPGASQGEVVGQTGLEAQYDQYLRGRNGKQQVQVNAQGIPTGTVTSKQPTAGHNLQTSLDVALQRAGQASLAESVATNGGGAGGAFVAMNPTNGEIYAMGSNPSFDPSVFTGPISQKQYNREFGPSANDPLFNRATQAAGPTGSTFKPITATAALQSGEWSIAQTFDDTGQYCVGSGAATQCRHNAGGAVDGVLNLVSALKVSSDDFFYHLGALLNPNNPYTHPNGGPLQQWARNFGIGRNPGIDLPDATRGTLPDPRWRNQRNRLEAQCDAGKGQFKYVNAARSYSSHPRKGYHRKPKTAAGSCGIADGTNRPWSIGDAESLAVGQGDVQVSPLQLARAYSAIANGGWLVTPHIGLNIENADGTVLQKVGPDPHKRNLHINPLYLQTIREGLHEAAQTPGGTSDDVMGNFPRTVYGKTGTAQYQPPGQGEVDYAWYSCFVPASATSKPIEVTVWVEKGGFGDAAAAPVARQILSQWFLGKLGPFTSGTSTTL